MKKTILKVATLTLTTLSLLSCTNTYRNDFIIDSGVSYINESNDDLIHFNNDGDGYQMKIGSKSEFTYKISNYSIKLQYKNPHFNVKGKFLIENGGRKKLLLENGFSYVEFNGENIEKTYSEVLDYDLSFYPPIPGAVNLDYHHLLGGYERCFNDTLDVSYKPYLLSYSSIVSPYIAVYIKDEVIDLIKPTLKEYEEAQKIWGREYNFSASEDEAICDGKYLFGFQHFVSQNFNDYKICCFPSLASMPLKIDNFLCSFVGRYKNVVVEKDLLESKEIGYQFRQWINTPIIFDSEKSHFVQYYLNPTQKAYQLKKEDHFFYSGERLEAYSDTELFKASRDYRREKAIHVPLYEKPYCKVYKYKRKLCLEFPHYTISKNIDLLSMEDKDVYGSYSLEFKKALVRDDVGIDPSRHYRTSLFNFNKVEKAILRSKSL